MTTTGTKQAVIRPGLLVALKTSVAGGVSYVRVDLEREEASAKWETTKRVVDPKEHEAATKARNSASALIRGCCADTGFGLLCPQEKQAELNDAVAKAQAIVDLHNSTAQTTRVEVRVLVGRIAATDEQAAEAMASEVRGLMDQMTLGVEKLDVKSIRDAASKAKQVAELLSDEKAALVTLAVQGARRAARQIAARVGEAGEDAAKVLEDLRGDRRPIQTARMAFLDLEQQTAPATAEPAMPATQVQRYADLQLDLPVDGAAEQG